ncbi:L-threonylcarbamoyladenylate synthase [Luteibaculum oceani]|uniref:L-threonylcarbamoyladenylate synthase n=1 Tax=Luteibaculum oceani TaxID=1294296 RepID=A0A5C6UUG8_9FLAO|nr:L-threonylcarbamoyladenylate synthase [Luteibaculum oceani]TXC76967.1 Sua5/YciO/YrdC/YwlC family protein [Luteibaculum oceani]
MNMDLKEAAKVVKDGGVILYPTETICGLGCDARNQKAIDRIFEIKNRPKSKSVLSLFSSEQMLLRHFKDIPDVAWELMELATTPTTVILDNPVGLAPGAVSEEGTAAVRWVKSGLVHELIEMVNVPLTSSSVNISGEPPALTVKKVPAYIKEQVDYVLYEREGEIGTGIPSSIIRIRASGELQIIRK